MKAPMRLKLKFDLCGLFSLILAISFIVFWAARISLAMEVQERLATSCQLFEKSLYAVLDRELDDKSGIVTKQCINEYKKPTLAIAIDLDKWSYQEIYADAIKTLK